LTRRDRIAEIVENHQSLVQRFFQRCTDDIIRFAALVTERLTAGNKVLLFGNGGSAADASHMAAEFVNRFRRERRGLPALALVTDPAVLTSIGNDYGFERIFARQIEALGAPGDLAVGISTSGTSENVLRGLAEAARRNMGTVLVTGSGGARHADKMDIVIVVPSDETPRIQEVHGLLGHIVCEIVESDMADRPSPGRGE